MTEGPGEASWIRTTGGLTHYQRKIIPNNFNKKIRNNSNVQIEESESEGLRRAIKMFLNTKQEIWRMDLLVKTITSCSKVNSRLDYVLR